MTTLSQKLKIKEADTLRTIGAPGNFGELLDGLPANVTVSSQAKDCNQVHLFVKDQAELSQKLNSFLSLLQPGCIGWIYFPKGSSGDQRDLTRDNGWDILAKEPLQQLQLISFNDSWSAFSFRKAMRPTKKDRLEKAAESYDDWIDRDKRTVRLPPDLALAFRSEKLLLHYFESLAFTHKREYVEWIISARKAETRTKRIGLMLKKLAAKKKNPTE